MCSSMNAVRRFCRSLTRGEYSKSIVMLLCSALQNFLDLLPSQLGHQRRAAARLARVFARRGAVEHALGDTLQDRGDPEQVVRHVVVPGRGIDALAAGAPEVHLDVLALARDAEI